MSSGKVGIDNTTLFVGDLEWNLGVFLGLVIPN